jgi:glycerophosphoryl diester phosphodiesterase
VNGRNDRDERDALSTSVPLILAHRGARRVAPENTLDAFARAVAMGADGVELDVRRTADGALVLHHDPVVANGTRIAATPAAQLRADHPEIPTLVEALDVCAGVLVNVEIKNLPWEPDFDADEQSAEAVVELLDARDGRDDVIVSSFHLATIDRVRATGTSVPTGLLTLGRRNLPMLLDLAAERGHAAIHPDRRAAGRRHAESLVADAHDRGLEVNVWTVNAAATIVRLADAGVDGLITDVPDVARKALGIS